MVILTDSIDNQNQIKQLIENWAQAVRNKDIEGIIAYNAQDFVMFDVPEPFQSVGIDAYRKTWDLFFPNTKAGVFDIIELHIVADENVGFAFAKMQCMDKDITKEYVPLDF